jgi:tetratricopeptide (TPR) repeat protein
MFSGPDCFRLLLILVLTSVRFPVAGQDQKKVDSLLIIVNKHSGDSLEVAALDELSSVYESGDLITGLEYAKSAVDLAQKLNYKAGILRSWNQTGNILLACAQPDEALKYYQKVVDNATAWGFPQESIRSYINIGKAYRIKGDLAKALHIYLTALKETEKTNDHFLHGVLLNSIGIVFEGQHDIKQARNYYKEAIRIFSLLNDSSELAMPLVDLGNTYGQSGNYDSALVYYKLAYSIYKKNNNIDGIASALGNMGIAYAESGNMQESYKSFKTSLDIALKNGDQNGACISYLNFGSFYMVTGNYNMATSNLNEGLRIAKKLRSGPRLIEFYELLSDVYALQENYKEAYNYHLLFTQFKDSILNDNNTKHIAQLQAVFDSEKKENELEKRKAEIARQTTQKIAFGVGLALAVVLLFFVIRGYLQKRKSNLELSQKNQIIALQKHEVETQKELIEEKQKEILDSITYARRIQKALLAPDKYIDRTLKRIKKEA